MRTTGNTIEELINELGSEKECRKNCALGTFSRMAARIANLSHEDSIYQVIGTGLRELVADSVVVVNSFDEPSGMFYLQAFLGAETCMGRIASMLGAAPVGKRLAINDEAKRELSSGTLKQVPGGLYSLAMGNIPKSICTAIARLLGIGEVYAVGFTWKGQLFGSANFLLRNNGKPINPDLVNAFVSLASIALQRHHMEETLWNQSKRTESCCRNTISSVKPLPIRFLWLTWTAI